MSTECKAIFVAVSFLDRCAWFF